MVNIFETLSKERLTKILTDYFASGKESCRCKSLVPYAQAIKDNIGEDFSLKDAIEWAKKDFFEEIARRYCYDTKNEYINLQKKIIEELNTPQKMITREWEPSVCPRCNEQFSAYEDCDDGYYRRAYSLERCPYCGQKIKWK